MSIIQPRTLKGFRDYLPATMAAREEVVATARRVYRGFGFAPIDTPALEYSEILLGKGGDESDRQMYRFKDHGGRDVALRFDLTVPLARFAAQHAARLGIPFKRYHVGPVWRGENTQRGRYREFVQFDFDTIGTESLLADVETLVVVHDLFAELGLSEFVIHFNNRDLLNGLLEGLGLSEQADSILRSLDKLPKIGIDGVRSELATAAGASPDQAEAILALAGLQGSNDEVLTALPAIVGDTSTARAGMAALESVLEGVRASGVAEERIRVDVSIARGLAYYTGTVFETFLTDVPGIGSVCSGGRYDDLASLYTKQRLPGIGGSLGVDRLVAAMEELGMVDDSGAAADIFVALFVADRAGDYLSLAAELRSAGLSVELYPDARKLGAQMKYADRRGHQLAVIIGEDEWERRTAQVKTLATGRSVEVPLAELTQRCSELLEASS
ncbi:MAG: histidine--tRNA ligase [Acidimicrobiia bacterium]|nr:histidine--tRNA ligase [Acidimicrobiia bacterium]